MYKRQGGSVAVMVTVAVADGARSGREHSRVLPARTQVPPGASQLTSVKSEGNGSVRTTPRERDGPSLITVAVYVTTSPAIGFAGENVRSTSRSARVTTDVLVVARLSAWFSSNVPDWAAAETG